jgi:hypothetical protein
LPRRAVKIEFEGKDGERYTIKLEGKISKEKVLKMMDMYELLTHQNDEADDIDLASAFGKVQSLIKNDFALRQFSSDEVQELFEDRFQQPISLAAVGVYLLRLVDQGVLRRSKKGRKWFYKLQVEGPPIPMNTANPRTQPVGR